MAGQGRVSEFLIGLGADPSDFEKALAGIVTSTQRAVADINRVGDKLNLFGQIQDNVPKIQQSLDAAKAKVAQLKDQVDKINGKPPKELADALKAAEQAVVSATRELSNQQRKLAELDASLKSAGVNTKNLAAEQLRLAEASKAAAAAAAEQAAKHTLGLTTLKDIQPEVQRLRAAYETLRASGKLSATELATAQQQLDARIKELNATVTKGASSFVAFGNEAKSAFLGVAGPALAAVGGIAAVTAAVTASLEAARAYRDEIGKLGAVTKLSKDELDSLGTGARQVARDLGLDVVKALESVREIVRSGIPADNAIEVLRVSGLAAKAALVDLAVGVKAASNLTDAFGLPVAQLGRAFDILNRAAKNGGFTLQEFAENAGGLLNVARQAGLGLEDVVTVLTGITKNGVDAGSAMKDLTTVIIQLGTPAVRSKLRDLGIEGQNLTDIFTELGNRGLNPNEFLELDIATTKSAKSMSALVGNAKALPELFRELALAGGDVEKATETLFETPRERAEKYAAALKQAEVNTGEMLGPTSRVQIALTAILNAFNEGAEAIKRQNDQIGTGELLLVDIVKNLGEFGQSEKNAAAASREFHEELIVQSAATQKSVAAVSEAVKRLKEFGPELQKVGNALTENTGAAVTALNDQVQRTIDALDRSLKKQVETAAAAATIERDGAAERLKIIQSNEALVLAALQASADARRLLGQRNKENALEVEASIAKAQIETLSKIRDQYSAHYEKLKGQQQRYQAEVNAIEQTRIDFNETINEKLRQARSATLSDLQQYADKAQEVDRLIAKGREVAATQGIDAAKKYFDQALTISESIKGEVLSDGTQVISAFEAQQKSIEKIKAVAAAYNDELDKAGDRAKAGGEAARADMALTEQKITALQAEITDLNKSVEEPLKIKVADNIIGLNEAEQALTLLTRDRVINIRVNQVGGGAPAPEVTPAFAKGGFVGAIRRFASGGPVFSRPSWFKVPGSGNGDTVPAMLSAGSFVVRKSSSQKYGDNIMSKIVRGYADGGPVGLAPQDVNPTPRATDAINYARYVERLLKSGGIFDLVKKQIGAFIRQIERNPFDDTMIQALVRSARAAASSFYLQNFNVGTGFGAMIPGKSAQLDDWFAFAKRNHVEGYADGGEAGDTVPAMLTPGEFVINKDRASQLGSRFLHALNAGALSVGQLMARIAPPVRRFALGGAVPGAAIPAGPGTLGAPVYNFTINAAGGDMDDPGVQRRVARGLTEFIRRTGK